MCVPVIRIRRRIGSALTSSLNLTARPSRSLSKMITEFFGTVLAVEYSVANRKRFVDSNQPFFFALYAVGHPTSPAYPEDFLRSVRAVALLRVYRWSEISVERIRELKDRIARSTFSRTSIQCSSNRYLFCRVLTLLPYVFRRVEIRPSDRSSHSC